MPATEVVAVAVVVVADVVVDMVVAVSARQLKNAILSFTNESRLVPVAP